MRAILDLETEVFDDLEITRADFMECYHPRAIVADPLLTVARKRAMLARWLSDANAVSGAPTIRRSPAGVTATVEHLRKAMDQLDEMVDDFALAGRGTRSSGIVA
jgi:hypothetical protein